MSNKTPQSQEAEYWKQRYLTAEDELSNAKKNFQNQFEHWKKEAKELEEKLGASVREISLLNSKIEELQEDLANKENFAPWMVGTEKALTPINAGDIPTPSKGQETNY